ncbi:large conductance mechanosensitive channel protein MscL [Kriegella aquimaris]|nr:large conductance mechanosensitive channel protein MscL [Kriegella aquimaris]
MKSFFQEFKNFAVKGNMVDMAIGIIIGTAFNNVVNVLVKKVVMPPLSLMTDDVHFSNWKFVLREAHGDVIEIAIGYGELIEVLIDFGIIALTIFVVLKFMNRFRNKAENPDDLEVETPKNIELLSKMEKLMKEQNELMKKKWQ